MTGVQTCALPILVKDEVFTRRMVGWDVGFYASGGGEDS